MYNRPLPFLPHILPQEVTSLAMYKIARLNPFIRIFSLSVVPSSTRLLTRLADSGDEMKELNLAITKDKHFNVTIDNLGKMFHSDGCSFYDFNCTLLRHNHGEPPP